MAKKQAIGENSISCSLKSHGFKIAKEQRKHSNFFANKVGQVLIVKDTNCMLHKTT
jgi:hypothetical protein